MRSGPLVEPSEGVEEAVSVKQGEEMKDGDGTMVAGWMLVVTMSLLRTMRGLSSGAFVGLTVAEVTEVMAAVLLMIGLLLAP